MKTISTTKVLLLLMLALSAGAAYAGDDAPTVAEQVSGLEAMCEAAGDASAARHAETPLYDRLGGYDRILEMTTEVVRLHGINPTIKRTLENVDPKMLAKHVADFLSAGTGGTAEYTGRDMVSSHEHLKLDDADFLAAGGDVIAAMKGLEYGEDEINEVVCLLVSLKDQVVLK